ncbi:DUF533 domain-containing protein [Palleronia sp. KMU-117]|uniref:DUF533 domain-containing protein n=1 Tax=Palleronia sp. KMU-117 TaxID=3434108 RepID=UPI003D70F69E
MSFVKTLATLAAGFAAAKGVEQYKKMGGMAGVKDAVKGNESLAGMSKQMDEMFARMGMPDASKNLKGMLDQLGVNADKGGEAAMAGLGGLMAALGGATAAGTSTAADMLDSLTGNKAASTTVEDNARLMIRAMIQAAKADGEIDAEERQKILDHLEGAGPEEIAYVREQLAAPLDLEGLVSDTQDNARSQVYAMSAMAVRIDSDAEREYLNALARGLGLSDAAQARIHQAMGIG